MEHLFIRRIYPLISTLNISIRGFPPFEIHGLVFVVHKFQRPVRGGAMGPWAISFQFNEVHFFRCEESA